MAKFHEIKDPACLRKFSFHQLCAIERSVFTMYMDAVWRLEQYKVRTPAYTESVASELDDVVKTNHSIWTKVRFELFHRIDELLTVDDILTLPVSTDLITQGEG